MPDVIFLMPDVKFYFLKIYSDNAGNICNRNRQRSPFLIDKFTLLLLIKISLWDQGAIIIIMNTLEISFYGDVLYDKKLRQGEGEGAR